MRALALSLLLATAAFAEPDLQVGLQHTIGEELRAFAGESRHFRAIIYNLGTEARDAHVRLVPENAVIEAIFSAHWDCSAAGGDSADCVRPVVRPGWAGEITVRLRGSDPGGTMATLVAEVSSAGTDADPQNNRAVIGFVVDRAIVVDTAADSGPGSLRAAIETANAECTTARCQVRFDLPPRDDWYTIEPRTPLPAVTADGLVLDARTQDGWVNLNPRIALDGHLLGSGDGLVIASRCSAIVTGFAIGNFPGNGISVTSAESCVGGAKRITENRIGTDPTGEWPWPNTRGIFAGGAGAFIDNNVVGGNRRSGIVIEGEKVFVQNNIIGGLLPNGASGVYAGPHARLGAIQLNVIADNADMGVAVDREARDILIRVNRMLRNGGLGIDHGLDGPTFAADDDPRVLSHAPVIHRVETRRSDTVVTMSLRRHTLAPVTSSHFLDFYVNDGPDGDGEQWVHVTHAGVFGDTFEVTIPGRWTGKWLNATSTRRVGSNDQFSTSELSEAVPVP